MLISVLIEINWCLKTTLYGKILHICLSIALRLRTDGQSVLLDTPYTINCIAQVWLTQYNTPYTINCIAQVWLTQYNWIFSVETNGQYSYLHKFSPCKSLSQHGWLRPSYFRCRNLYEDTKFINVIVHQTIGKIDIETCELAAVLTSIIICIFVIC